MHDYNDINSLDKNIRTESINNFTTYQLSDISQSNKNVDFCNERQPIFEHQQRLISAYPQLNFFDLKSKNNLEQKYENGAAIANYNQVVNTNFGDHLQLDVNELPTQIHHYTAPNFSANIKTNIDKSTENEQIKQVHLDKNHFSIQQMQGFNNIINFDQNRLTKFSDYDNPQLYQPYLETLESNQRNDNSMLPQPFQQVILFYLF